MGDTTEGGRRQIGEWARAAEARPETLMRAGILFASLEFFPNGAFAAWKGANHSAFV